MEEPKIEEIGGHTNNDTDSCTTIAVSIPLFPDKSDSSKWSTSYCIGGPPRVCTNYKDIDEIIKFGCDGKLYSMKEVVDFDDEKFDRFYQQMLQFFNENPVENPKRTNHPLSDLTLDVIAISMATTQTHAIFALQIVINRRENRILERRIDLLLK